jgi:dihydropteroate synthase
LSALAGDWKVPLSVDTQKARGDGGWAVAAGASIINDIAAFAARRGRWKQSAASVMPRLCLMHMQGEPGTMQDRSAIPSTCLPEVARLSCPARVDVPWRWLGIAHRSNHRLIPVLDLASEPERTTYALLREFKQFCRADGPAVLAGISRKSMLGADERDEKLVCAMTASVAAALIAVQRGAGIVRLHDVPPPLDALKVWQAVCGDGRAA